VGLLYRYQKSYRINGFKRLGGYKTKWNKPLTVVGHGASRKFVYGLTTVPFDKFFEKVKSEFDQLQTDLNKILNNTIGLSLEGK
jgi:hypothetical protein